MEVGDLGFEAVGVAVGEALGALGCYLRFACGGVGVSIGGLGKGWGEQG